MLFNRTYRYKQFARDLAVGISVRGEHSDPAFCLTEPIEQGFANFVIRFPLLDIRLDELAVRRRDSAPVGQVLRLAGRPLRAPDFAERQVRVAQLGEGESATVIRQDRRANARSTGADRHRKIARDRSMTVVGFFRAATAMQRFPHIIKESLP